MKINPHPGDIVSQPIGLYNTQAVGVIPSAFSFGSVPATIKSKPLKIESNAPKTIKDEERLQKRLLAKQKQIGKQEVKAMPSVDIASQEQFNEDVALTGGKKAKKATKAVQLIASEVVMPKRSKTKELGGAKINKQESTWMTALRMWNDKQSGPYKIPKKGTKEYDAVKALMK
jgi:hypothetical protein